MRELAEDVYLLDGFPRYALNVYLVGEVLIDAGTRLDRARILKELAGRDVSEHVLTHAHPDHFGSSRAVCERLGIPVRCGEHDLQAVQRGKIAGPRGLMLPGPPAIPGATSLREGEQIAGFTVLDTPGHSPGHISLWRESDRTLICGDVMWGWHPFLMRGAIREPFLLASPDPQRNRDSARRIAALSPALVCFGHGPPLHDPAPLTAAVAKLPD
jgi:hydroxyacylglutathione hydrolase